MAKMEMCAEHPSTPQAVKRDDPEGGDQIDKTTVLSCSPRRCQQSKWKKKFEHEGNLPGTRGHQNKTVRQGMPIDIIKREPVDGVRSEGV
jgi:hypothetical protein